MPALHGLIEGKKMKTGLFLSGIVLLGILSFAAGQAGAMEIQLEKQGEVYTLPVRINGVITLNFILDSGASEVCIPSNILPALMQAGTITNKDFLPGKNVKLADGSLVRSSRFMIRELNIGGYRIFNVPAVITPKTGFPLLGQSFLNKVESWTLDNRAHKLTLAGVEPEPAKEAASVYNAPTSPAEAAKSTANASQPPSSPANTTQPHSEPARKLIPPRVRLNAQSQTGPDVSKSLIEPSVNHENTR